MDTLHQELKEAIQGEVRFDEVTRRAYSVDASIYEVMPLGVVTPKSTNELLAVMAIAKKHRVPIIARGAATGITGGCIGPGIIVDLSKYLRSIIEINVEQEYVICQPGVVQDEFNAAISSQGYRLGPDTSTGNRATIGGMLANNAAGARSLRYGKMVDHVLEVTLALAGGTLITLKKLTDAEIKEKIQLTTQEGTIYRTLLELKETYTQEILERFPKIPRRVSGYNLDELIKDPFDPAKLIAGSEGTLGIAVEIKLRICKKPKNSVLCVMHCHDMLEPMRHLSAMLRHAPLSLEMIDAHILAAGRSHPTMRGKLSWLEGNPQAVYIAEFDGESSFQAIEKLRAFQKEMEHLGFAYSYAELTDALLIESVWELRKAGLGLLLSKRTYSRAIAFIEDLTIAPEELFPFMTDFLQCLKSFGKEAGIYGHVGSGCLHIRPYIDLNDAAEQQTMEKMMLAIADLLLKHHGALSGEHGDGYIRSWLTEKMFGSTLYQAFCKLKAAFDPENLINPGKIVHAPPLLHDLRSQFERPLKPLDTFLDFNKEGGFELAADLCNGNALCRKREGVMCPSFQVTRDEYDTTRARAQALRAIIHGHSPSDLSGEELHAVLDLCIQCKGCLTECPSQVDMAKMKSEVLYHYHKKHGVSWRTLFFGKIGLINQLSSPFSSLVNTFNQTKIGKKALDCLGIATKRSLPMLAKERFTQSYKKRIKEKKFTSSHEVVLFVDTFTEFNHPEIGLAAIKVLETLGYSVIVPKWSCCGRTLYSKGMLHEAQKYALHLIHQFLPFASAGIPIIGLEPSCISMLTEDIGSLVSDKKDYLLIRDATLSFDAFLHRHLIDGRWPSPSISEETHVLFHAHCHQRAHEGASLSLDILNSLPGCQAELIPAGCCGLAGSFGYEKEHFNFSMEIGSLKLFPAILKSPKSIIVANGTSCRHQIFDGTEKKAIHLAEFMASRIDSTLNTRNNALSL